jgi:hypothetical protein
MLEGEYEKIDIKVHGDIECLRGVRAFIGCSQGVWVLDGMEIGRITEPRSMFGITFDPNGDLWAMQNKGSHLHRSRKTDEGMSGFDYIADLRCLDTFYRQGIHQIDFIDDELFVCDTYNNRILVLTVIENELQVHRVIYPEGRHRPSRNMRGDVLYRHFNSIYRHGAFIYVLAHNDTGRSKIPSQLYVLEKNSLRTVGRIDDVGGSAHNIVVDFHGVMYILDSLACKLVQFDGTGVLDLFVDERKTFLRGLAMNDDITLVGGSRRISEAEIDGAKSNDELDGFIFVLDKKKKKAICTLELPKCGQIHEIRLDGFDYGLSNTWRKPE